jgi:hypothetical protein
LNYKWEGMLTLLLCMFAGCATLREPSHDVPNLPSPYIKQASLLKPHFHDAGNAKLHSNVAYVLTPISDSIEPVHSEPPVVAIDSIADLARFQTTVPNLSDSWSAPKRKSVDADRGEVWDRLLGDQAHFYSGESMLQLGLAFGAAASIANTQVDDQLQKHFQSSVRGASSDEWFHFLHASKELGNGIYTIPVFSAAWIANEYIDGPPQFETVGFWGERSLRGIMVGAPSLILLQHVTGGSRPYETNEGSEWHPLRDNNGVSGHAFMSSLPFITAAKLTDNVWQKTFWYTASAIGPLSRVSDNAHYPSQIGLGWMMAMVAASAVEQTDTGRRGWTLVPQSSLNTSGIALQYKW